MSQRSYPLVLASWLMVVVASLCWGQSTRPTTQPADMTVEAVRENIFARLLASVDHAALPGFETDDALQHITPLERTLLSTGRVSFHLDAPATLYLLAPTGPNQPFWLDALGFEPTDLEARVEDKPVAVWRKPVEAGRISLGINSLTDERYPYFLAIVPRDPQAVPTVSELTPETLRVEPMLPDSRPYVDRDAVLRSVPEVLQGSTMVRTSRRAFRPDAILSRILQTDHVASTTPDQIVLTWSDDPRTTQSINWRTSTAVTRAQVRYRPARTDDADAKDEPHTVVDATTTLLESPTVLNDPRVHRHAVTLTGLRPGTTYEYAVGDGSAEGWTPTFTFTTAPLGGTSFRFIYTGDVQNGFDEWAPMLRQLHHAVPDAAFHLLAGDLVDRGGDRDDWDRFFHHAGEVYAHKTLVPAVGNHELDASREPSVYLRLFRLPDNGPPQIAPGRAYSFEYSNALIVVLDSNLPAETQTDWLEQQLRDTTAEWKIVSYHHPAFASHPTRDNARIRAHWTPLFDRYDVQLVLQGHDHAYLRTYRMYENRRSPDERGAYYVVSYIGNKSYEQDPRDHSEVALGQTRTWQVIEVDNAKGEMRYRAVNAEGRTVDRLTIPSRRPAPSENKVD